MARIDLVNKNAPSNSVNSNNKLSHLTNGTSTVELSADKASNKEKRKIQLETGSSTNTGRTVSIRKVSDYSQSDVIVSGLNNAFAYTHANIAEIITSDPQFTTFTNDYTRIEYLKTDGSSLIVTEYTPNENTVIETTARMDVECKRNTQSVKYARRYLFGTPEGIYPRCRLALENLGYHIPTVTPVIGDGGSSANTVTDTENSVELGMPVNTKCAYKLSMNKLWINGEVAVNAIKPQGGEITFPFDTTITIGGIGSNKNNTGMYSSNSGFIGKIYDFAIYENDELKHRFVPCTRNIDNKVGMFDTVTGLFYHSITSTDFGAPDGSTDNDGVKQVGYIELSKETAASAGSALFNTGVVPDASTKVVVTASYSLADYYNNMNVSRTAIGTNTYYRLILTAKKNNTNDTNNCIRAVYGRKTTDDKLFLVPENTIMTYTMSVKDGLLVNGTKIAALDTTGTMGATSPLAIFGSTYSNVGYSIGMSDKNNAFIGKIYQVQIYKGDNLIRNFIPVVQNVNDEPCFYDTVEKKLYHDCNTAGNVQKFTYGNIE